MCRRKATLAIQEGLSKLSSEYLGAIGPQELNTRGRGDKNNNLSVLLFCRKNRKDNFTKKKDRNRFLGLCGCVFVLQFAFMKENAWHALDMLIAFSMYRWQNSALLPGFYALRICRSLKHAPPSKSVSKQETNDKSQGLLLSNHCSTFPDTLSKLKQFRESRSLSAFVMISGAAEVSP